MKLQVYVVKTGMKNDMHNKWKQIFPLFDVQLTAYITFGKNIRLIKYPTAYLFIFL